jgi:hypothetical protein
MSEKKISAFNDLMFHKTFGSEENKDILAGLVQDFYGFTPKKITLIDPYDIKCYAEPDGDGAARNVLRHTRKDVSARLETADFTMELQVRKDDYFDVRSLKYAFERFVGNYNEAFPKGEDERGAVPPARSRYATLRPVYTLNILKYRMFPDEESLRILGLYDGIRKKSLDKDYLKIAYFELEKPQTESKNQAYWRDYFLGKPVPAEAPDYIRKADELLLYMNLTQEERKMLDREEYALSAYESELYTARHDGWEEGRKEGRKETLGKVVAALSDANLSKEQIDAIKKAVLSDAG